ncbi:MAG: PaaI family thioesterase [Deltaproteobacteria bacterium]|nr:PaaI family thioesterase [Deltaproteobacteria bacterium]
MVDVDTLRSLAPGVDVTEAFNDMLDGWNRTMGLRFTRVTSEEVVAELTIDERHRQPYGLVHGGVYCGMIETVASVGAALDALSRGQSTVGLDNHTSFLRATREGRLQVTARAITRGRRTQLWEGTVTDDAGRAVASGRVRMICLDPGTALAGETVAVK